MTENRYDVIVVGARCAGSPTAMLLARAGYRVLVVDRATFPSDTISTHLIHPPGVAALRRWGLLDRVTATGCPPIHTYSLRPRPVHDLRESGDRRRSGRVRPAAHRAGQATRGRGGRGRRRGAGGLHRLRACLRRRSGDRDPRARQGRAEPSPSTPAWSSARTALHSLVAQAVRPDRYHDKPRLQCSYYTYYSGLPMDGRFEVYIRPDRGLRG